MPVDNSQPWDHPEVRLSNLGQYLIGYTVTLALLGLGLALVHFHAMAPLDMFLTLSVLTLLTTIAKLVFLFHLDFSETQRWNTVTLALNVPLLILSIGLTAWMFRVLSQRVMMM